MATEAEEMEEGSKEHAPRLWTVFERQAKGGTATVWLVTRGTECYRREGGATFRRRASTFRSADAAQRVADRLNKEADPRSIEAQIRRVQSHPAAIVPEDLAYVRKLLTEAQQPCVTLIQRQMGVGFNYAQQLYLAATGAL
jgi:hypothetical protein